MLLRAILILGLIIGAVPQNAGAIERWPRVMRGILTYQYSQLGSFSSTDSLHFQTTQADETYIVQLVFRRQDDGWYRAAYELGSSPWTWAGSFTDLSADTDVVGGESCTSELTGSGSAGGELKRPRAARLNLTRDRAYGPYCEFWIAGPPQAKYTVQQTDRCDSWEQPEIAQFEEEAWLGGIYIRKCRRTFGPRRLTLRLTSVQSIPGDIPAAKTLRLRLSGRWP